jgi:outer membrane assembly lipoprotein YfiO
MNRSVTALLVALALALSGCAWFGDKTQNRKDWGAADWYKAAKDEFDSGNWDAAIKLYEQLESKYPYGKFAQQAQLEIAYSYYKQGESAQAISALDKFIKTHPNHENIDYALYLRALVNFKEDLGPLARIARQDLADRDPKAARESFEGLQGAHQPVPRQPLRRRFARSHGLPHRGARRATRTRSRATTSTAAPTSPPPTARRARSRATRAPRTRSRPSRS